MNNSPQPLLNQAAQLSDSLRDRVLERLGFAQMPLVDLVGLQSLYAACCTQVPFDNARKMIALRTAGNPALPGGEAEEFFAHWLADE